MFGVMKKTIFEDIQFNKQWHRYTYQGNKLTSVTQRLKDIQKPFDQDGIARRVAKKQNKTVDEVLAEWDAKGEDARNLGTAVHEHIEQVLIGKISTPGNDPFLNINRPIPEIKAFDLIWAELELNNTVEQVEWVIGDVELGLAGTVDLLTANTETGLHHIIDWKTGKFDLTNRWEDLLPPFNHLDACKFHIYSLQQSLYRLIIERNTAILTGDSYLIHLRKDGNPAVHKAADFRKELYKWLTA